MQRWDSEKSGDLRGRGAPRRRKLRRRTSLGREKAKARPLAAGRGAVGEGAAREKSATAHSAGGKASVVDPASTGLLQGKVRTSTKKE